LTNTEKSPEELRAELAAKRAQLGDTVEELAHRVDVPAQVKAKKDDTVAKLHDAKVEATRRVHEGTEKVKAAIADKTPVVQQKVDQAKAKGASQAEIDKQLADMKQFVHGRLNSLELEEFCMSLIQGVRRNQGELDQLLSRQSKTFPPGRDNLPEPHRIDRPGHRDDVTQERRGLQERIHRRRKGFD